MQFFLPNTDEHGKFSGRKKKTELALKELAQLLLFLMLTEYCKKIRLTAFSGYIIERVFQIRFQNYAIF